MSMTSLTALLSAVLVLWAPASSQGQLMVCKKPHSDCMSFRSESGGDEVTNQCLESCNFAKVPGVKPLTVYRCRRSRNSCTPDTVYYADVGLGIYTAWRDCMHTCRLLSYANATSPASHLLCFDFDGDCFKFKNRKGNIVHYMKCYFNCQINRNENETKEQQIHLYSPVSRAYVQSYYFSLPKDKNHGQKLKACYKECEKESATSLEARGHKCDEDSKTCVPCTQDEDCQEDLEDCQETCGKETISPEAGGYKCDLDSKTCVPCTEDEEYCEENLEDCQDTCDEESTSTEAGGYKCDPNSKTCVACTDGDEDCVEDLDTCSENCGEQTTKTEAGGYKCDPDSKTCVPCTDAEEDCGDDLEACQETCGEES